MTVGNAARTANSSIVRPRSGGASNIDQIQLNSFARQRQPAAVKDRQYGRAYQPQQQWSRPVQPQYPNHFQQHFPQVPQRNYQYQSGQQLHPQQHYQHAQQYSAEPNELQHAFAPYTPYRNAVNGLSPIMQGLWNQQPEMREKVEAAGLIVDALTRVGINPRIGGSLAARAYGGIRDPQDIDVEMSSAQDLNRAYAALIKLNALATLPSGEQVHVRGYPGRRVTEGRSAQVNIAMTRQNGKQSVVGADLVNENCPNITPNLLPASMRGVGEEPGNMIAPHLVAGFLSRYINNPEFSAQKQDVHQIAALIRNAGINPNSQIAYFDLAAAVSAQFLPSQKALAAQKFREILTMMTTGQL